MLTAAHYLPRHRRRFLALRALLIAQFGAVHEVGPYVAYVNHGRWVADCVCGAGMPVDPAWDRGLCLGCGGAAVVTFPGLVFRAALRLLLRKRPMANRNWLPGETLAQLRQENLDHGVGV